jgi:hypothetical protein
MRRANERAPEVVRPRPRPRQRSGQVIICEVGRQVPSRAGVCGADRSAAETLDGFCRTPTLAGLAGRLPLL